MIASRRRVRAVLAALTFSTAIVAGAGDATAQGIVFRLPGLGPTSFSFTNTTIASFRTNNFNANPNDDNFFGFVERFDSAFNVAPWRLQVRLDAFLPLFLPIASSDLPRGVVPGSMAAMQWNRANWSAFEGPPFGPPNAMGIAPDLIACTSGTPCYLRWDLRPERIALRYQRGIATLEAGDVYTVLGRGLVLSFRKVDPLGLDTVVRGGRAEIEIGRVTVRGVGGIVNPQNYDPLSMAIYEDTQTPGQYGRPRLRNMFTFPQDYDLRPGYDWVAGGDVTARFGPDEDFEFAGQYVHVQAPASFAREYGVDVLGWRAAAPSLFDGALAFHVEVNALRRNEWQYATQTNPTTMMLERGAFRSVRDTFGRAVYAGAQVTAGNWNMNFEWKDYRNYLVSPDGTSGDLRRIYSASPSLERFDVQFRSNSNTRGGRVTIDHAFRPSPWSASITVAASGFAEDNTVDPWSDAGVGVVHTFVTLRRRGRPAPRMPGTTPGGATAGAPATGTGGRTGADASATSGAPAGGMGGAITGGIGGSAARVAVGEWQLSTSLGFRHEALLGRPAGSTRAQPAFANVALDDWQVIHSDIDVVFAVSRNVSVEVAWDGRFERRWTDAFIPIPELGQQNGSFDLCPNQPVASEPLARFYCYLRTGVTTTVSITDRVQISGVFRFDNSQRVLRGGFDYPVIYPAGEVRWMFTPGSTIRVFGGMTPGGRLCSGGVCRDVPPFQGALAELVLRI